MTGVPGYVLDFIRRATALSRRSVAPQQSPSLVKTDLFDYLRCDRFSSRPPNLSFFALI
jgi:hypothetical protein